MRFHFSPAMAKIQFFRNFRDYCHLKLMAKDSIADQIWEM